MSIKSRIIHDVRATGRRSFIAFTGCFLGGGHPHNTRTFPYHGTVGKREIKNIAYNRM